MKNMVFSLIQKSDTFLVVEISMQGARLTRILADFVNRTIEVQQSRKVGFSDNLAVVLRRIDTLKSKIILILDSDIGFTVYSKIPMHLPVGLSDESDFENIGMEALQKFFSSIRSEVANKLSIDSTEVALLDARFLGANLATLTCVAQKWAEGIFKILPINRVVMCVEGVATFGRVVASSLNDKNFIFSHLSPNKTEVLSIEDMNISYLDYFSCGTETILDELVLQIKFPKSLIKYVVNSYHRQLGSAIFLDKFGLSLSQEYKIIENGLRVIAGKSNLKSLCITSSETMPDFFTKIHIKNHAGHFMKIFTISNSFIGEKLGFEVKYKIGAVDDNFQIALAGLWDFYLSPQSDAFLKIVKRKVRWINESVT